MTEVVYVKPKRRRMKRRRKPRPVPRVSQRRKLNDTQLLTRQQECQRLRYDEGLTYRQIAQRLDIDTGTARRDVMVVRQAMWDGLVDRHEEIIEESNERYDQLMARWLPLALNPNVVVQEVKTDKDGNPVVIQLSEWESAKQAADMILKICTQRERLNGLHDPKSPAKVSLEFTADALAVADALRNAAMKMVAPKVIKAEVVTNELEDISRKD